MSDGRSEAMNGSYFMNNKYVNKEQRITPEKITKLKENEIFVFGSNESGRHGKGAAKQALTWGAIWGQAEGLQGRTYGIPTKDKSVKRVLSIEEIKVYVIRFMKFADENPDKIFLVTKIGCGLSKLKPKQVAPLFKMAKYINNIHLPERFWHKITNK